MTDLSELLGRAHPADLLPTRRSDEAARMELPLELAESRSLGAGPRGELHHLLIVDARGVRYGVPAVVDGGVLRRARPGDGAAAAAAADSAAVPAAASERDVPDDQTNELVIVGDECVVKWYLHPSREDARALQRLDLVAEAGFVGTPRIRSRLLAADGSLLAVVSDYLPGAEDGWTWLVDEVRAHALDPGADALASVAIVGRLVADLHLAFASTGVRAATTEEAGQWRDLALADAEAAELPADVGAQVRSRLMVIGAAAGTPVMPIHGDLHVGQVLRTPGPRYHVIDFDGNPLVPVEHRWAPEPAARDVAGMLAALDHVGRVVLHRTDGLTTPERDRVIDWIGAAQTAFLDAYRGSLSEAGAARLLDDSLLIPFMVQQECREYVYAARYLPHWRYVPDATLPSLLAKDPR